MTLSNLARYSAAESNIPSKPRQKGMASVEAARNAAHSTVVRRQ
jgi:hypothetical protein